MIDGTADEPFDEAQDEPLGLPRRSVRSLLSLGVVVGAFAIAAYLLVEDTSRALKSCGGRLITALGNVIGFYFGVRSAR